MQTFFSKVLYFFIFYVRLFISQFILQLLEVQFKWQNVRYAIKQLVIGNKISIARSHVSRRAPRTWKPNLRTVTIMVNGQPKKVKVCAKCLRAGKVTRV